MKKYCFSSILLLLFTTFLINGCTKEDTQQPTSSGDARDKFLANWSVTEYSSDFPSPGTFNCTVSDSSNSTHVLFAYLYGFTHKMFATVSGNNVLFPSQTIEGTIASGTGVLVNANQLNLSYLIKTSSTHWDTVTTVLTK